MFQVAYSEKVTNDFGDNQNISDQKSLLENPNPFFILQ